jgi:hypothetical protein
MKHCIAICSGIALCLFISLGAASAAPNPGPSARAFGNQGQGRGNHGRGKGGEAHGRGHSKKGRVRAAFSVHDQEIIRSYFREYPSDLPPGLAKRGGDLPPGLEKQLREGGTLPPGLQKRLSPCPVRLSRRLPPLPSGYSRKMLGTQLLILDSMNVVRDIMILSR